MNASGYDPIHQLHTFFNGLRDVVSLEGPFFQVRSKRSSNKEFKCRMSFVFDGVPHSVVGSWQRSRRSAKLDMAGRAVHCLRSGDFATECSVVWSGDRCRAVAEVPLFGALHRIQGALATSESSAKLDVYLRLSLCREDASASTPTSQLSPRCALGAADCSLRSPEEIRPGTPDTHVCHSRARCLRHVTWRALCHLIWPRAHKLRTVLA